MAFTGGLVGGLVFGGGSAGIGTYIAAGAAGGALLSSATGSAPVTSEILKGIGAKPPAPPVINIPPVELPTPQSPAVRQVRRRNLESQLARRGRRSTILTQGLGGPQETLG